MTLFATFPGAVYKPLADNVPGEPTGIFQVTEVVVPAASPEMFAVNCWVLPFANVTDVGFTVTMMLGAARVSTADADLVGSAALVAFTVTV